MNAITVEQAQAALQKAEQLHSPQAVATALDQLAAAITERCQHSNPVVLVVMNGAVVTAGQLLTRLHFPLQIGYVHATRYQGTEGNQLKWRAPPSIPVAGRTVLIMDDIFDEGTTLKAILDEVKRLGAVEVLSAVLVDKIHQRKVVGLTVDFVGLTVADRYVFGCGMDYHEYWRNLPAIYAI